LNAEPSRHAAAFGRAESRAADKRRLRILHVFRAPVGGLFRHVVDLARAQIALGLDVGIFCDSSTGGEHAAVALEELRRGLTLGVTRVPMRRNPHPLDATAFYALMRTRAAQEPNVLHGHGSKGAAYARAVVSPRLDRSTIRAYTPHGGSFNYRPGTLVHRVYMGAEGLLAKRTDVFLFESDYIARRFRESVGATDRATRVVHNGISEAEFEPIAHVPDPFDLVYVGELRPAKGVETLIDAVAQLRRADQVRLTLLIVGSGPDDAALQARAKEAGIWDSVAFVPPQPIRHALARGAVMVIPSYAESLPYVILEAAAAGQPLVATNVGGIPEIFGPHAGELIPPRDTVALARAIRAKHSESDAERRGKAESLSAFVRCRFSLKRMVDGVLDGYEAAFAARRIPVG
jgi:glycosyltransferase involved in cell wall biosynthesis